MSDETQLEVKETLPAPARRCDSYWPGHMVHYIQVFKSVEDEEETPIPGRVVDLDDTFVTVALSDGIETRYRNHELDRLRAAIERFGGDVLVQERWHLLRIPSPSGCAVFSIAPEDAPWTDCREKR